MSEESNTTSIPDVLCFSHDSNMFRSNTFFCENPGCLILVIYQDAFEAVNPLGSTKKEQTFGCVLLMTKFPNMFLYLVLIHCLYNEIKFIEQHNINSVDIFY